jgi:hypothetical protein
LRTIQRKTRRDKITNEIQTRSWNSEFVNSYKRNYYNGFSHVKGMDRMRILRRTIEIKFKGKRPMG